MAIVCIHTGFWALFPPRSTLIKWDKSNQIFNKFSVFILHHVPELAMSNIEVAQEDQVVGGAHKEPGRTWDEKNSLV